MTQDTEEETTDELGWPFGRNKWPYVVGTEDLLGAVVWGYDGGDANAVAWTGTALQPIRYCYDENGELSRPPVDVGAEIREDLRL